MTFHEAERRLDGLTAAGERRLLVFLAARTPRAVQPDHLTALALAATFLAGCAYALAGRAPGALHVVNLGLFLNWLGDSLDGTLARYRHRTRPRYGFYVDHLCDCFGALFLLGGLALSGLMHPALAAGLLVAYYLLSIEIYLATYTVGVFQISFGPVGGTELRLLLGAFNLLALRAPSVTVLGRDLGLFDLLALVAIPGLVAAVLVQALRHARHLAQVERLEPCPR
jgi:phosphatidylglycerophosphate synthase